MTRVRKAVIPAAGLGTRFLTATKAVPKEMLPVVDRPAIEIVVQEILDSGLEEVIFITGRQKGAIIDHFDVSFELESALEQGGKTELLERVRHVTGMIRTIAVRQKRPLGLGHAVLCARAAVGDEPFAVLLPDDIFFANPPVTRQLVEACEASEGQGVVALVDIPREDSARYGVIDGEAINDRLYRIDALVEKPAPEVAPSTLALPGRYVLPSRIFDYLEKTSRGVGGEIQLTDALDQLARNEGLRGLRVEGQRFDTGNVLGYLKANLFLALQRPDLAPDLRAYVQELIAS